MNREDLQFIVRAAIAARDAHEIHQLLERHGLVAFSQALAPWSTRAIADGLTLLGPAHRAPVIRHLPPHSRTRLEAEGLLPHRALQPIATSQVWSAA